MKRTPLERFEEARLAALEFSVAEAEKTRKAESDPKLTLAQRLELFKQLQAWPRIVLGLYNAELAAARRDRKKIKKIDLPEHGREEPSEIAYGVVGKAIGLGAERIRQLSKEGREHRRQGMPAKAEMRAAEFLEYLGRAGGSGFGENH